VVRIRPQCVATSYGIGQVQATSDLHQDFPMKAEQPDEMISVRVSRDLREAIERAAVEDHRTISQQVRYWVACGIETRSQPQHAH
jgi:ParD-like antitoxin of type II bacterial toxin-antitoxin system